MKRKKSGRIVLLVAIVIAVVIGAWFYIDGLAYKVCRVEAGVEVVPSDFLKKPNEKAYFTEKSETFSIVTPGEYQIKVKNGLFTHSSTLIIEDTQKPKVLLQPVYLQMGKTCTAEDFVVEIEDVTEVTVSFAQEPDFRQAGGQTLKLVFTDLGNNVLMLPAELTVSPVKEELVVEAGSDFPSVQEFLLEEVEASFVTDVTSIDMTQIAEHAILLQTAGMRCETILHVVDTVAPEAELQNVSDFALLPKTAEDFVVSVSDVTPVNIAFVKEPDFTVPGVQTVEISMTDAGGNETIKQAELNLIEDTEAPTLTGAKDITIYIGDSISYRKGVSATDNCEDGVTMEIDNSLVNPNEAGIYPVTYRATDLAGNVTEQVIVITIKARSHTLEEVNELADAVLAKIMKPEMTQLEKVRAIYDYNMRNIGYINHSEKGDWIQAAYEGLAKKKGDCYVYACTAKLLLTRAGITNMDIAKIPAKTSHYWNLVDIGDGWYHFDTTPRKDHPTIFMWTDEQMIAYSNKHNKSHNYDPALYPEIN